MLVGLFYIKTFVFCADVFTPHPKSKLIWVRLIENVRFFATDVFSPRHSANTSWFALCSRLIENVE